MYVDHFSMHNLVVMLSKPNSGILRVLCTRLISIGESLLYFWTEFFLSLIIEPRGYNVSLLVFTSKRTSYHDETCYIFEELLYGMLQD